MKKKTKARITDVIVAAGFILFCTSIFVYALVK